MNVIVSKYIIYKNHGLESSLFISANKQKVLYENRFLKDYVR